MYKVVGKENNDCMILDANDGAVEPVQAQILLVLRVSAVIFALMILIGIFRISRGSEEPSGITFPVLSDIILDAGNPEFVLKNPSENKGRYILKYEFTDTATGRIIFSTNWLEGGKQYHYTLDGIDGTTRVNVHIYAKDSKTHNDVSGVNIMIGVSKL